MSSVRLYILGALAELGPMHGHQIRREAQTNRTELWTDIKVGSLYAALGRMADEGIIEAVRTERAGNMPARTVYAITDTGRQELAVLRGDALREVHLRPDPVDLALQYSAALGVDALVGAFTHRRAALQSQLDAWRLLHAEAAPHLSGTEPLSFQHTLMRLESEIAWHDHVIAELPGALTGDQETPS
ncbi:PadR family transcriptional regulator [Actinomycetospora endophytica]|uniref:PadR family transcriptional regulator n=1 Tax=Actinomycetospora endophytica TaxID=2291215 RepID=A0ABS8PFQ0_9PSEU|nr:PadR family transcriptional regulator [Actinomycetospora endophytica]MCD2196340.1 PadR family transcriptional regulator [Actinomycetospora endophytica]